MPRSTPASLLRRLGPVILLLAVGYFLLPDREQGSSPDPATAPGSAAVDPPPAGGRAGAEQIERLYRNRASGVMVEVDGIVDRTLPDDREGSPHQRFIVRLDTDRTVLIAHNIDLAPRVPLTGGDPVRIRGQYEWNERGGVLHWTHHDPRGRRKGGWIRHRGEVYR